jgi:hypothetical protein
MMAAAVSSEIGRPAESMAVELSDDSRPQTAIERRGAAECAASLGCNGKGLRGKEITVAAARGEDVRLDTREAPVPVHITSHYYSMRLVPGWRCRSTVRHRPYGRELVWLTCTCAVPSCFAARQYSARC